MKKRYMLFCYDGFYPSGGMNDFINFFDNLKDAENEAEKLKIGYHCYHHIFDNKDEKITGRIEDCENWEKRDACL